MEEERKIQKKYKLMDKTGEHSNSWHSIDTVIPERKHRFVYGSKLLFMNETKKSETRSFKAPQTVIHFT